MRTPLNRQRGFTLIELLLYLAISSGVLVSLVLFAWNVIDTGAKNARQDDVYASARYISERLKYEIRKASDINVASSNFALDLATNAGQLSLASATPNDPTIIDVDNNTLRIKQGAAAVIELNSPMVKINSLIFENYSTVDSKSKHVVFTISVEAANPSPGNKYENATIESSAELRSH